MKILFATQNKGKQKEIISLLGNHVSLLFPQDLNLANLKVEESGKNFSENAFLKARAFADKSGVLSAADDSGLSVAALDGLPGVYSDRYFPGSANQKNLSLLKKLINKKTRRAKFVTVICLYDPKSKKVEYFEGEILGNIALEVKGKKGFGYDPIFIPDGFDKTWGQLGPEEKNKHSHRAIALEKLKKYLVK